MSTSNEELLIAIEELDKRISNIENSLESKLNEIICLLSEIKDK